MSHDYAPYGATPAFARPADHLDDGSLGLTKREYFAALAMQGLLADPTQKDILVSVRRAVVAADALIVALNKGGEK